ncbi:hypothetical protein [Spiroplasma endosymbiont of Labia minor]|uniref:hypothetical protein n=1 Tax=Spiroplasma endosymbiont of Labia minor TaxID=3066305 RepID=UPI0030D49851
MIIEVFNDDNDFIKYKKNILTQLKNIYFTAENNLQELLKKEKYIDLFTKMILIMREFNISFNKLEVTLIKKYSFNISIQNDELINFFELKFSIFDFFNKPYVLLWNVFNKCVDINDCKYLIDFLKRQLTKFKKISVNNLQNILSLVKLLNEIKLN